MKYSTKFFVLVPSLLTFVVPCFAGGITNSFPFVQSGSLRISKQDSAGNFYLVGSTGSGPNLAVSAKADAVVTKVSNSGAILFSTVFGGSKADYVSAVAIAPDGSIAAVGNTASPDFPLTPDAAQTQFILSNSMGTTGFYVRMDRAGKVIYSSYLNSNDPSGPAAGFAPATITLDTVGSAFVSGVGSFISTPGALPSVTNGGWILKLDGTGKIAFATGAFGGALVALDGKGFIYTVGGSASSFALPVTPEAFQSSTSNTSCTGNAFMSFPCYHQYVVKLDPSAGKLIYATWISGTYGAWPSALVVDDVGNVILAGSTQSTDYPITMGAYQPVNYANSSPRDNSSVFGGPSTEIPLTGYVTKLNAAGSGLIFSTYLGGSGDDSITSMVADVDGKLYLAGITSSSDFPGLPAVPNACRPSFVYPTNFLTRMSADGSSLAETLLAFGLVPNSPGPYGATVLPSLGSVALDSQGKATAYMAGTIATLDLFKAPSRVVCATDAANMAPLASLAPGQLVSLFGEHMGPETPVNAPSGNSFPLSLGGVAVTFNDIPAPILYAASDQVNIQVPYEVAGSAAVIMKTQPFTNATASTAAFVVVPSQPSAFLQVPQFASCGGQITSSVQPLAFNADGTVNTCSNPAGSGTSVHFFLNGLGTAAEKSPTGSINTVSEVLPISGQASFGLSLPSGPIAITTGVGLISSVAVATIPIPQVQSSALRNPSPLPISLTVNGVPVLDSLVIWLKLK